MPASRSPAADAASTGRRVKRGALWVWLLGASALVLAATPIVVRATRPPLDAGFVPATVVDPEPASPVDRAEVLPEPSASSGGIPISNIVVRSARLEDYEPPRGARPVGLSIDAIDVRASVVPVGIDGGTRSVEVPTNVDTIGWFRFGPSPGGRGSAVLIGHVDSRAQGAGAFFRLRELEPGDVVTVSFANGSRSAFRVVGRRSYPKEDLPTELFARSGRPVLTLVTCGGAFEQATGSYADNVVVFAVAIHR